MIRLFFLSSFIFASASLFAKGSAVGLDGGELFFKEQDGLSMEKQTLYLSYNKVKVKYEFLNRTSNKITSDIGFPLKWPEFCGDKNFNPEEDPLLNFEIKVNGKEIQYFTNRELIKAKDSCNGEYSKVTYHWPQFFPPNGRVKIEYSYKPVYSSSILETMGATDEEWDVIYGASLVNNYCATKDQVGRVKKKNMIFKPLYYIQSTDDRWKGKIKEFELVIDKEDNYRVFLCTNFRLKKVSGENKFIATKKNYRPSTDIKIAFVFPSPAKK